MQSLVVRRDSKLFEKPDVSHSRIRQDLIEWDNFDERVRVASVPKVAQAVRGLSESADKAFPQLWRYVRYYIAMECSSRRDALDGPPRWRQDRSLFE